ncbi:MAG: helix-turn-helix domain-containing protein [Rhizobiaceae bacterium]
MSDHYKLFDTSEAAKYTNMSASFLAKARVTGETCPYIKIGRRVLYRKSALDAWLDQLTRYNTSE